jgi:hypothetical protein
MAGGVEMKPIIFSTPMVQAIGVYNMDYMEEMKQEWGK